MEPPIMTAARVPRLDTTYTFLYWSKTAVHNMLCSVEEAMGAGAADRIERVQWTPELAAEFERNQYNGCVGTELVSESERVRVWMIHLAPGRRIAFHRHVLDYFWTAVTAGRGRP